MCHHHACLPRLHYLRNTRSVVRRDHHQYNSPPIRTATQRQPICACAEPYRCCCGRHSPAYCGTPRCCARVNTVNCSCPAALPFARAARHAPTVRDANSAARQNDKGYAMRAMTSSATIDFLKRGQIQPPPNKKQSKSRQKPSCGKPPEVYPFARFGALHDSPRVTSHLSAAQ